MISLKSLDYVKLLTPTRQFRDLISKSGEKASLLHVRLVFSWLVYRSRHDRGASARQISRELHLHPQTVSKVIKALGSLATRRGREWIAAEPPEGLFFSRKIDHEAKHWSENFAYSILYQHKRDGKVIYPETQVRFGLSHAVILSYLLRKADQATGMVGRFTIRGAAKLFDLDVKTVQSVMSDLAWLKLIKRIDFARHSQIDVEPLGEKHLEFFQLQAKTLDAGTTVEAKPRPARAVSSPQLVGDSWDNCRRRTWKVLGESVEEIIGYAKRVGEDPDAFLGEFSRVKAIYDNGFVSGKISTTKFASYLGAAYRKRIAILDEVEKAEAQEQAWIAHLNSPETQARRAKEIVDAAADPSHSAFTSSMIDDAIAARVKFDDSPILAIRKLDRIKNRLHTIISDFLRQQNLMTQAEMDAKATLRFAVLQGALIRVNTFYKQEVLANQEQFEQAIDSSIRDLQLGIEPFLKITAE
jgi:hypothetical protein